jgi:hypothetical protein
MRRIAEIAGLAALIPTAAAMAQPTPHALWPGSDSEAITFYYSAAAHRQTAVVPLQSSRAPGQLRSGWLEMVMIVDVSGRVVSARAIAGPDEFIHRAIAQARQWTYKPFVRDGSPVVARIRDSIPILPRADIPAGHVAFPAVRDPDSVQISLGQSGCYGTCPAYKVVIAGDGSVTYTGDHHVAITGQHRDRIPRDAVALLIDRFRRADFLSQRDAFGHPDDGGDLLGGRRLHGGGGGCLGLVRLRARSRRRRRIAKWPSSRGFATERHEAACHRGVTR